MSTEHLITEPLITDPLIKVAVTLRVARDEAGHELRDALAHDWVRTLMRWGVVPYPLLNPWPNTAALLDFWDVDAVLLTGGGTPRHPGVPEREIAPLRDQAEDKLLRWALERERPIVGVCRGAEMINLHFGGAIHAVGDASHLGTHHHLLATDRGWSPVRHGAVVNSYHDWAIAVKELAPPFQPFALAPDGVVEGFYHPERPILAVQWHPERDAVSREPLDDILRSVLHGACPWQTELAAAPGGCA